MSCLCDNNILTTAAVWSTLILCGLLSGCILFDTRARRMWVMTRSIIVKYGEYYRQGQEKEKERQWRHQRFSEMLRDFQIKALRAIAQKPWKKMLAFRKEEKKKSKKRLGNNNVCTHGNSLIKAEEGGGVELHSLLWLLLTKLLLCAILQTDPMSNKAYRAPSSSVWKACAWRYRGCVLATATQGSNPTCGPTSLSHCPVDKAQKIYLSHFVDEQ